ncbi:unnamed protein product [Rhizophagus irregularis]|nr:unnamed protein product [Rhizophagus irregularis]
MNFKCPFCSRTFSKRSAYAQHIPVCPKNNVNPIDNESDSETSINAIQDVNQNNEGDISHDEMEYESYQDASFNSVQSTFSVMSYEDILECEESEKPKEPEKSGESAEESEESGKSVKGSEESAEESEESEESAKRFEEYEESAEEFEESGESAKGFENSEESEESAREKELESSKESEETYTEFPNEAYKDLMILVTKHKLNNKASNIPTWRRNKPDAKQLLGYLPILEAANNSEKKSPTFKILVRETFHKSLQHLLELINIKDGIELLVKNEKIWFYPRISIIITDWPEAATFCLTYKSSNSKFPCHFCMVARDNFANINLLPSDVKLRTHEEMFKHFNENTEKTICIESVPNFFWKIPNINIYLATVPDRMHHLDLGLFRYQIEFTYDLLKLQHNNKLIDELDCRIAAIPRYPGLKIFSNGLQSISRFTADEYRNLMKIMIFVVDNLYSNTNNNMTNNFLNNNDLNAMHEWAQRFIQAFKFISSSQLKLPKLHSWLYHIIDSIRLYGVINGYTTETYESLHKNFVKIPYRISNKKNIESQLLQTIRRQAISSIFSQQSVITKTPYMYRFSTKLFEFSLKNANLFFNEKKSSVDSKMQTGFSKFLECLDLYLDLLNNPKIDDSQVKIFGSVTIENGNIIRATNSYHNKSWFSNVAISMNSEELEDYISDQGICYGQTLLLAEISIEKESLPLSLALIQWYDFKSQTHPYLYGCPHLKLKELFNFVTIEAIQGIVHIIPRFAKCLNQMNTL